MKACASFLFRVIGYGLFFPVTAFACWEEAAVKYQVAPELLVAIAMQESSMRSNAVNLNKNNTVDIGIMQINSIWLPKLREFGIERKDLFDPCINIHVGAWILGGLIREHGLNWDTVGRYNGGGVDNRSKYAWKVYRRLTKLPRSSKHVSR